MGFSQTEPERQTPVGESHILRRPEVFCVSCENDLSQLAASPLDTPLLRYLDAFPVESDGRRLIYLRDPEGLSDQTLAVPLPAYYLMTLFDGKYSIAELREAFAREFDGHEVTEDPRLLPL